MRTIEIINPQLSLAGGFLKNQIRHILFDFDGTISLLRQGWEKIMAVFMLEMICGKTEISNEQRLAIEKEVSDYIDASTGILTIKQMEWLEEAVRRHGLIKNILSSKEYKAIYLEELLKPVRARLLLIDEGKKKQEDFRVPGIFDFLEKLKSDGMSLYIASGTDQDYVASEAKALGVADFFEGRIYGALDDSEANDKSVVIKRILEEHDLPGNNLLVVGDGPVEMRDAKARSALALGVASDEILRQGWNERKRQRLIKASADFLISDFKSFDEWWN
jgi:phosphoglycolate phosphatase-like HAD superfamily hydrolase